MPEVQLHRHQGRDRSRHGQHRSTARQMMSDHPVDLDLIQIAVRVGLASAITVAIAVGAAVIIRFSAGAG
jgi:hypothetical protein